MDTKTGTKRKRSESKSNSRSTKTRSTRKSIFSNKWPSTLILFISTHGNIVCENNVLKKFILPPGMEINRVQIATPGEVNIASEEMVNGYISMINAHKNELLSNNLATQKNAIQKMANRVRYHDEVHSRAYKEIAEEIDDKEEMEEFNEDLAGYLHGQNRSHRFQTYRSTKKSPVVLINKLYTRENEEATKNDWSIKVMNVPGQPDLLQFLRVQTRQGKTKMYLKEIVNECKNRGVKKIIMFDFSCGSFSDSSYELKTPRETRMLRRRIIGENS